MRFFFHSDFDWVCANPFWFLFIVFAYFFFDGLYAAYGIEQFSLNAVEDDDLDFSFLVVIDGVVVVVDWLKSSGPIQFI